MIREPRARQPLHQSGIEAVRERKKMSLRCYNYVWMFRDLSFAVVVPHPSVGPLRFVPDSIAPQTLTHQCVIAPDRGRTCNLWFRRLLIAFIAGAVTACWGSSCGKSPAPEDFRTLPIDYNESTPISMLSVPGSVPDSGAQKYYLSVIRRIESCASSHGRLAELCGNLVRHPIELTLLVSLGLAEQASLHVAGDAKVVNAESQ